MKDLSATFTSKGQLVVPAELRRKHGIETGTRVRFLEDHLGRIVLQPITEEYVDRLMGCLSEGPDLLAGWEKEHREEGKRDK
ncbi:MAG TPA: AbrB/MazE/SpoVT family DNA-binding domain-containing protein [Terriglobales bacterium]|jgi:AbrB family looped-hinge helix DNA binding protein|nr:AbrB/MazE/SpoVT family DNA-binding domain-containing protein [Terriglobales bacterium]